MRVQAGAHTGMVTARSKPLGPSRGPPGSPFMGTMSTPTGSSNKAMGQLPCSSLPREHKVSGSTSFPQRWLKQGTGVCVRPTSAAAQPHPCQASEAHPTCSRSAYKSTPTGFQRTDMNAQSQKISFTKLIYTNQNSKLMK